MFVWLRNVGDVVEGDRRNVGVGERFWVGRDGGLEVFFDAPGVTVVFLEDGEASAQHAGKYGGAALGQLLAGGGVEQVVVEDESRGGVFDFGEIECVGELGGEVVPLL